MLSKLMTILIFICHIISCNFQDDETKTVDSNSDPNDPSGLIELLEDDNEPLAPTNNETENNTENCEPGAANDSENTEDEIIEINGDEMLADDELAERSVKIKVEEEDEDSQNDSEDDDDDDDREEEDAGARLDDDDEEYDGERALKYKSKKEIKVKKPNNAPKKLKRSKEVLIPQMVRHLLAMWVYLVMFTY